MLEKHRTSYPTNKQIWRKLPLLTCPFSLSAHFFHLIQLHTLLVTTSWPFPLRHLNYHFPSCLATITGATAASRPQQRGGGGNVGRGPSRPRCEGGWAGGGVDEPAGLALTSPVDHRQSHPIITGSIIGNSGTVSPSCTLHLQSH